MADFLELLLVLLRVGFIGLASSTHPKSVNLAVETSFLIEPEDVQQNTTILRNVRQFIDKLENLLNPASNDEVVFRTDVDNGNNNGKKENQNKEVNGSRFTKFLTELGGVVINSDDDDVRGLLKTLNDEVTRLYVSNSKFHEMFQDVALKLFIKNIIKEWMKTDPVKLKVEIAKYITSDEGSPFVTFFQNLNQFFENDKAKLDKLAKKFAKARKTKQFEKPLEKIFDLIFERFEKLDQESNKRFRGELDKLSKHVIQFKNITKHEDLGQISIANESNDIQSVKN